MNEIFSTEPERVAKTWPLPCFGEHRLFLDSVKPSHTGFETVLSASKVVMRDVSYRL